MYSLFLLSKLKLREVWSPVEPVSPPSLHPNNYYWPSQCGTFVYCMISAVHSFLFNGFILTLMCVQVF